MDIYFQGYGFWFTENEPGEPLNQLTPTYLVDGVFRLKDRDAIQFHHTKKIDDIYILCPSSHKDDEFSKVAKDGSLKGYKPERCWFSIDPGINACTGIEPKAVIAEPDSPSGVLEVEHEVEHVEAPIAANKFSIDALIETRIPALFIKAKIDNDLFTQSIYKVRWVKMLEKERDYLSGLDFSDLRESRLQRINAKLKDFQKWANDYGQKPSSERQAEAVVDDGAGSQDGIEPASVKVSQVFSEFIGLRANEISLVMMKNGTAKAVIRGKSIKVSPGELGLKVGSQDWKLMEGAAVSGGELESALKKLNSSSNLEAEKGKVKTAVSRLRKSLKNAMGLIDNPINYTKNSGYNFAFKTMTHELLNDGNVTKGDDAMDYVSDEGFEDNQHGSNGFWIDDD